MIRIVMLGRTGNNLFQYAVGRVISERHGVPLVMDGSLFNRNDWRSVSCLGRMGLRMEVRRGWSWGSRLLNRATGRHPLELLGASVVREDGDIHAFDPNVLDAPANAVLIGYFQSPKYFDSIERQLRSELDLSKLKWGRATREMGSRLGQENMVAVHVRRTDFVGRPDFDLCGPDYYRRAMDRMRETLGTPRFHFFSDDPAWCHKNFSGPDIEVNSMSGLSSDPLHDLYLMSCARHHVIANSSYSWWAAWMGAKEDQQVIAPDRWFGSEIKVVMKDRLVKGWEALPTGH